MFFLNEYTIKEFGLEGDCTICDCGRCSKTCTDCDWIAVHGPVNCHNGGVQGCPYMPKPLERSKGLFDSDKREDAKRRAEELVFISMSRGDIERECKKRDIKITLKRAEMESKLVERIYEEILESQ